MSTVYQGIATEVRPDWFFDLVLDTGETIGLYADDKRIDIKVLPKPLPAHPHAPITRLAYSSAPRSFL